MPILRDENGVVYTSLEYINQLISPTEVGVFKLNKHVPKALDIYFRQKGMQPSTTLSYDTEAHENVHERIQRSLLPHTNGVGNNEAHLILSGTLIIYIDNGQGQYAVLLQAGDWIYIDGKSEAWLKLTFEKSFILTSYHSAPIVPVDEFHKDLKYTSTVIKFIL